MRVRRVIFAIVGIALLVSIITPAAVSADTEDNLEKASKKMLKDATKIEEIIVPGVPPGKRISEEPVSSIEIKQADAVLSDVPAFDWCYGCSATSAAMMFGYYDRTGYSNMYAGPTNGGVCPLDNSDWGSSECPLSATHQGYDGLAVKGHVDDYWYYYGSTVDPYDGYWAEHGYADCTADFMGTNQYVNWQNVDGSTRFYYYTNGNPLYDYSGCEPGGKRDGCHGIRLFVESRGYNVVQNYNQYIHEHVAGGFTYANFKAEIDAGRPVIIHVTDHSMLGYGYTDPDTIYIHDTWSHTDHFMTWGGIYSGLEHYAVTVIEMPYRCGNMNVNPTSWSPTLNCCESDNEVVSVSASGGTVKGVTVSKVSGPTWLSVSPTNLGDIASGSSKTFTIIAAPPSETSGDFAYTVRVSNTCGTPPARDVTGTIHVDCCGNMGVNPTSWSPTLNCSESDNEIVTVSGTGGTIKGVTVSKVSGPTWLSLSPTNLGAIPSGSSKTFTMTASPPSETSGDFTYTVRVSNTCGTPSTRDVTGTIHVDCPCGNMDVNPTSWSTTIDCGESDSQIVTVSASDGIVNGVTVSKVSCPTWLSVSPTNLGDIASGSSKTFTVTAAPPAGSSGDFTYTVRVSNTCGTPSARDVSGTIHVDCPESSWTFMIYLDGDNNLESAAIDDFIEMSSVGSTSDVNIVVQFDRIPGYVSSYDDWTDCKRFHVTAGMTPTVENATEDFGECNMGDPNTLDAFVTWAMTEFPADNYALILWNHGDGWKSINNWVPWADDIKDTKDAGLSRGICVDDTDDDYLSLQETEQALTGKYVQLLGYDACLMHMIEVVHQVMANARISAGSEEVEPWDGWPYNTILADLAGTPTMSEDALGTVIVDRYMASYPTRNDLTQSAVDNLELPNLVAAVDNLAQALINEINGGNVADVQQARNAAAEIYYTYYIDLYHFAEKIQTDVPGATAEAHAVMDSVGVAVYEEAHGSSVPNDHGLSIYFPLEEGDYLASYDNTTFAVDTLWDEFLKEYYAPSICGNMNVNPTSWSPTLNCCESDSQIVSVSASDGTVKGVTVSKISGPTWLSVSPTNLGDIAAGSSNTFTITAAPPSETSGDFTYTVRVSNTCGTPSTRDVTGTITVYCPELSYSPTSYDFGDKCEGVTDSTTFELWNSGTGTLTYSLSETCGWVEVNPTSGSSTGEHNTITVDIDTTGLFEGLHTCDITINSNDGTGTFTVRVNIVPKPDLVITEKWLCWPDNCTICYNVTNTGDGTAPACHNTTLYVDGVAVAHDPVPVDLAPGETYTGCFNGYVWTYTPPSDNITVCADNNEALDELDEDNNGLTNIWMCGDVNGDEVVDMSDVIDLLYYVGYPGQYTICNEWAADVNCDEAIDMSDVIDLLYYVGYPGQYELKCCCL